MGLIRSKIISIIYTHPPRFKEDKPELDKIEVKCYSGHTYAERPVSFTFRGKEHRVESIEKEWRAPGERWFLAKTGDNKYYKLCYNEAQDEWSITQTVKEQENAKRNT